VRELLHCVGEGLLQLTSEQSLPCYHESSDTYHVLHARRTDETFYGTPLTFYEKHKSVCYPACKLHEVGECAPHLEGGNTHQLDIFTQLINSSYYTYSASKFYLGWL